MLMLTFVVVGLNLHGCLRDIFTPTKGGSLVYRQHLKKVDVTRREVLSLGYRNCERRVQCTVTRRQLTKDVTGGEEHLCCSLLAFSPSSNRVAVSVER